MHGNWDSNMDNKKMFIEEKINKIGIAFFYSSVMLEVLIVIIDKSNYTNPIEGQLFRITFLLAAVKILCTKYTRKEWIAMILFGLLGFLSYRVTERNEILRIVVFIAACKGIDMKKMLKFVFYITLAGCALLIFLSISGIYGRLSLEADFGRGYIQTRYCLGIGHPNALHCMFMMLMLLGLYLYNDRMRWYYYIILCVLNYGLFVLTDSNTGVLMTFCTILGAVIIRYFKGLREKSWVYIAGIIVFLACVIFSVLAAEPKFTRPKNYALGNSFIAEIESHLNGRITNLYYDSVNSEGTTATWSLFSRPENNYYFDMGFVRVFYWYGVIPGMIYIILNVMLLWQGYRKKDGMLVVLMSVLAVYTIVEAHIISVYIGRNYILFLMGMYISDMLSIGSGQEVYLWKIYKKGMVLS